MKLTGIIKNVTEKIEKKKNSIRIDRDIERLAKEIGTEYEVSTTNGDRRIISNPNKNINRLYQSGLNRILIVGDLGTNAYPIFRYQIWNTIESHRFLWVDNHGNDDFIHQQIKQNIDFVYDEDFDLKINKTYDAIFLNGLNLFLNLEKINVFGVPIVVRTGLDDISGYSLNKLKSMFDLIVFSNPYNNEIGESKLRQLLDQEVVELFDKRNEVILIYEDMIKHSNVVFSVEFPIVRGSFMKLE